MRLLIITYEFPPFAGGAGVYSWDLAMGLAQEGHEVHVLTNRLRNVQCDPTLSQVKDYVDVHYHDGWTATTVPRLHYRILKLHFTYSFDVVLVTERRAQEVIALMKPLFFDYVPIIHGTEVLDYFGGDSGNLFCSQMSMKRFYENAVVCIAVSKATRELALKSISSDNLRVECVLNGISALRLQEPDISKTEEIKAKYATKSGLLLCLARLDLDKGQDTLLHALTHVQSVRPDVQLLIVGEGPRKNELMKLRNQLNLQQKVHFLGKVDQDCLPNYFAACDVFVLPSKSEKRWEGFGLVYSEANYYGKPVVGGNEGGVPEAIEDHVTGLIVKPRDPLSIAEAIVMLLNDASLRRDLGKNGKRKVTSYFNNVRMARETAEVTKQWDRETSLTLTPRNRANLIFYMTLYFGAGLGNGLRNTYRSICRQLKCFRQSQIR